MGPAPAAVSPEQQPPLLDVAMGHGMCQMGTLLSPAGV